MSTQEYQSEQKSSVAVTMNAKGEAQVAVKVYEAADPATLPATLDTLRSEAVRTYLATVAAVRRP